MRSKHKIQWCSLTAPLKSPRGDVCGFNPFQIRDSERIAERFIGDLRTDDCARIVGALNGAANYDPRICLVMSGTTRDSLVWRQDEKATRLPAYDIPQKRAKLWIAFRRDEVGFVVSSVSVIR